MPTATFIRRLESWKTDARVYQLDPPLTDRDGIPREYVIASASLIAPDQVETYLFPADEESLADEDRLSNQEMRGSTQGTLSHHEVLRGLGYTVNGDEDLAPWPQDPLDPNDPRVMEIQLVDKIFTLFGYRPGIGLDDDEETTDDVNTRT
jgi:hypothetical protein